MGCGSHVGGAVSKREFDLRPSTVDNIGKSTAGTAGVRPSKRPVPITRANVNVDVRIRSIPTVNGASALPPDQTFTGGSSMSAMGQ